MKSVASTTDIKALKLNTMSTVQTLQEYNQLQRINQVPAELLSDIFVLCDESTDYRSFKPDPKGYIQFVAPAVCRHWRKIALRTTPLWTTIRLVKPVPCKRAELYLNRSGSTAPLVIRILLIGPVLPKGGRGRKKLDVYIEQARKAFAFIIEHGGSVSRWRNLSIGTDIFASCVAAMDFLASTYLPALDSLEFVFMGPWSDHPDDEKLFFNTYAGDTTPKLMFSDPPPQLRSVKMEGVMNPHLFGDFSRPQLLGLTDIDISFAGSHPNIDGIYSMLAANPRLVTLCFNSGDTDPDSGIDMTATIMPPRPRVILPDLLSLTFMHITEPVWILSVIKNLQAPALQTLELSFWSDPAASQLLVDCISDQGNRSSPYFPVTLSTLSFFTVMGDDPNIEPLLRAYPSITTLRTGNLTALLKRPWLVPNLVNLDIATREASELKDVVIGRCEDGLPLKKVEARWFGGDEDVFSSEDREQIENLVEFTFWARASAEDEEGEISDSQEHAAYTARLMTHIMCNHVITEWNINVYGRGQRTRSLGACHDQQDVSYAHSHPYVIPTMSSLAGYAVRANRLPTEILSAIFTICECTWNPDSYEPRKLFGCQLTLPAVCQFWRKVALDTTVLWTRMTIANDAPYDLLELFLSRSGTALLDISVYMNRPIEDYDDEGAAEATAEEIHKFLKRHCSPSRWNTFRLEVNYIYAFYMLGTWPFNDKSTFPSLQSMELIFTGTFSLDPHDTSLGDTLDNAHLEFSEPQPQLRFLKIRGLLSPHVFGTSFHKQLTSLVKLELHFSGQYEWYDHDRNIPATHLLSKDPTSPNVAKALETPKVHMPVLMTLSFLAISSPIWVLNHLLTLDAPKVTTFELTFGKVPLKGINGGREAIRQLVSYISTSGPVASKRKSKPLFPSLAHLIFSSLEECFQEDLGVLLAGYPQINSLALPECLTLQPLVESTSELVGPKAGVKDLTELKEFLAMRHEAGMPLRTVQVGRSLFVRPIEPGVAKEFEAFADFLLVDEVEKPKNANSEED
ncbi:unnamed protein product [Rhizoctonia solani]|uniref:F-box domain-containing protein n=1 Tax=Rhizoctonia solani TaxID=456999 RepID=A0A8H3H2P7_9AGAM|nr:unnamed protein product [Rhizoctonia solani]